METGELDPVPNIEDSAQILSRLADLLTWRAWPAQKIIAKLKALDKKLPRGSGAGGNAKTVTLSSGIVIIIPELSNLQLFRN